MDDIVGASVVFHSPELLCRICRAAAAAAAARGGAAAAVDNVLLVEPSKFEAPFDRDGLLPQKATIDGINEKIKSGGKLTRTEKQTLRDTAKQTIEIAHEMERKDVETLPMAELRAQLDEENKNVALIYQGVTGTIQKERG